MKTNKLPLAKAIVMTTDGDVSIKYFENDKPTLKEMQDIVGGHIELVHLSLSEIMVVNEEGLLNGLDENQPAIDYLSTFCEPIYPIVGNVFVIESSLID